MPDKFSIFDLIGAAAGVEDRRTESSNQSASTQDKNNHSDAPAVVEPNAEVEPRDYKAQQEKEQFGSNTSELHEFMQKNRMDSMQAQLDIVITEIRAKTAETTGKEIDNDLRKKNGIVYSPFHVLVVSVCSLYVRILSYSPRW